MNHSNELMLIYFFCAVFINLYSKTKHSNETFHLEFYSLSNVFSYRKRISSKSNKSVLTISGKSRNIKIMDPSLLLLSPPQPPPLPFYYQRSHSMVYSQYSLSFNLLWPLPILRHFSETPNGLLLLIWPSPLQLSTEEYTYSFLWNQY